jgi:transcriptional regulator with GAF, ATPase, and Fis domain
MGFTPTGSPLKYEIGSTPVSQQPTSAVTSPRTPGVFVVHSDIEQNISNRSFREILGESPALKDSLNKVQRVAPTDSTVLVLGETGTGKELIARAIHNLSDRCRRPFVRLNCAAIPSDLLESELFGHEKGAFTGALSQRIGRFEIAHTGTLLLDEIGDLPLSLQPKLLRVLQEREFERLGGTHTHQIDVRLVAATHCDLAEMVRRGQFRSDLYYRINVFPIAVPPLRARPEDIPELVWHFVDIYAQRIGRPIDHIPKETMDAFRSYSWPGNIRELQNFIERAVILAANGTLPNPLPQADLIHTERNSEPTTFKESQRALILRVLEECAWIIGGHHGAAEKLGLKRTTLITKMRYFGITRPQPTCDIGRFQEQT